jgi:hypothetical protein
MSPGYIMHFSTTTNHPIRYITTLNCRLQITQSHDMLLFGIISTPFTPNSHKYPWRQLSSYHIYQFCPYLATLHVGLLSNRSSNVGRVGGGGYYFNAGGFFKIKLKQKTHTELISHTQNYTQRANRLQHTELCDYPSHTKSWYHTKKEL